MSLFIKLIGACLFFMSNIGLAESHSSESPRDCKTGGGLFEFGGMGGPLFKMSNMGNGFLFETGGRGGMSIGSIFILGGGGFGTIGQTSIDLGGKDEHVSLGYGGVGFGFKIFPSAFIHISNFNMFGMGRLGLSGHNESSTIYVIEPELNAEFSLISFLRLGLGVTYRYIIARSSVIQSSELSGFGGQLYLEFGWL